MTRKRKVCYTCDQDYVPMEKKYALEQKYNKSKMITDKFASKDHHFSDFYLDLEVQKILSKKISS